MLDLETLGLTAGAIVLSIGAVEFDRATGVTGKEFYTVIDLHSSIQAGLSINSDTWSWWLKQSSEARLVFTEACSSTSQKLEDALRNFSEFIDEVQPHKQFINMWGNGSDFDNVILQHCYELCGIETPWLFYNNRCHRTFRMEKPEIKPERLGIHHNALDDAKYQVMQHADVYKAIYG